MEHRLFLSEACRQGSASRAPASTKPETAPLLPAAMMDGHQKAERDLKLKDKGLALGRSSQETEP